MYTSCWSYRAFSCHWFSVGYRIDGTWDAHLALGRRRWHLGYDSIRGLHKL